MDPQNQLFTTQAAAVTLFSPADPQFPSLSSYRSWLESQGGAFGNMQTAAVIEADLNGDGEYELLVQLISYPSGKQGLSTSLPTPNRLVVFGLNDQRVMEDQTARFFPDAPNGIVSLDGRIAANAIGRSNADTFPDIALALDRADGRLNDANIAAKSALILSNANGTYRVVETDEAMIAQSVVFGPPTQSTTSELLFSSRSVDGSPVGAVQSYQLLTSGEITKLALKTSVASELLELVPSPDSVTRLNRLFALSQEKGVIQYFFQSDGSLSPDPTGSVFPIEVEELQFITTGGVIGEFSDQAVLRLAYRDGDAVYITRGVEAQTWIKPYMGSDEVLAVAVRIQQVSGALDENGDFVVTGLGQQKSVLSFVSPGVYEPTISENSVLHGEKPYALSVVGMQAIDLNGDGHQDLIVAFKGGVPSLGIFINSGTGNFYSVPESLIPDPSDLIRGSRGDIYPTVVTADSGENPALLFVNAPSTYFGGNYYLYSNSGGLGTGPGYVNAAELGVPGFNEQYYLENNSDALAALETGVFATGFDHYVAAGKPDDALIFAPGSRVLGSVRDDLIFLREGDEYTDAGAGNDRVFPRDGQDTIFGGAGIDVVVYSEERSRYVVSKLATQSTIGWQVFDPLTNQTDTLFDVEKLEFGKAFEDSPQTEVSLDVEGNPAVAYRIYRAAFAREPDLAGLGYWVDVFEKNNNNPSIPPNENALLLEIVSAFVGSPEFKTLYGDDVSNDIYVLNLYQNTLGRNPLEVDPLTGLPFDLAGYNYWRDVLDQGLTTRQHMFVFFSESKENMDAVAKLIGQGVEYEPWYGG
jgi:hypothetical protein